MILHNRLLQAILRSLNNTLEHLHHSYFFYCLMDLHRFYSIMYYMILPSILTLACICLCLIPLWRGTIDVTIDSFLTGSFFALSVLLGKEAFIVMTVLYVIGNVLIGRTIQTMKRFHILLAGFLSLIMLTVALYDISIFNQIFTVDILIIMTLL